MSQTYIKEICKNARDKTTSDMGSKKIANLINETLKKIISLNHLIFYKKLNIIIAYNYFYIILYNII